MLRLLLVLAALLALAIPALGSAAATRSAAGVSAPESAVLREMNRVRASHGLAPLRVDRRLQRAARAHTRAMLAANAFVHGSFGPRMNRFRVTGSLIGENLAWGMGDRGTARSIVAAWIASPPHRANLLGARYRRIGVADLVGHFQGYNGVRVVTADFAG
ncbi:MAG: CAP domain-containing protein [Actinobacteria bacterium]|nr:CAP domain-containing protein [Actinomycetota bacterium]